MKTQWATVEEYIAQEGHSRVRPPERCPHCGKFHTLDHLGYYQRGCTDSDGKVCEISVSRFECSHCGRTVSCLPDFAQPYRLINNATIQKFFSGDRESHDVERNSDNLRRYWQRFVAMVLSAALVSGKGVSLTQIDIAANSGRPPHAFPPLAASSAPSEMRSEHGNCVSFYYVNDGNFPDVNLAFNTMAGRLGQRIGCSLGRGPPKEPAAGLWQRILAKYRTLANATRHLVSEFKTTCFGKYDCHSPAGQVT